MKANELMIGDWVLDKQKKPIKVEIINDNDKCINEVYCQGDIVDEIRETDIEPIPLTPEILVMNGFEYMENDNEWWHYDPFPFSDFQIGYNDDNDMRVVLNIGTTNIRVNYVHKLQHALRLCGLNDLSDNFKIE